MSQLIARNTSPEAISSLVRSGHNDGTWDGATAIATSTSDAASGLTALGIATGEQLLGLGPSDTALWEGETIGASDVIVKYTYAGDANLDGIVSGDDYSLIDFNIQVSGAFGWYNGDFNYDSIISGDDYSTIDFNILAQVAPL